MLFKLHKGGVKRLERRACQSLSLSVTLTQMPGHSTETSTFGMERCLTFKLRRHY